MFLQERAKQINEKLKKLKNISNIVIWGAGIHTNKLFERTELLSYNIGNIVDINPKKSGDIFFGFTVKSPEDITWKEVGAVVVSVPKREKDIFNILRREIGYWGTVITFYDDNNCTPFHLLYDERVDGVQYLGNYASWGDAAKQCKGYDDDIIFNKVIRATQKVLNGEALWERDSFLFYQQKYVYKICASIVRCAMQNCNKGVRVLDIGGSLGSTYFQNKSYLADIRNLEYVVVEQDRISEYGCENLENDILKFIKSNHNWEDDEKFDIILMSASLQYIENYEEIISKIKKARPCYIILDRILVSDRMRICKEIVPEKIYSGSYPVIIFSEKMIREFFEPDYILIENDISSVPEEAYFVDGKAESRYYVFHSLSVT